MPIFIYSLLYNDYYYIYHNGYNDKYSQTDAEKKKYLGAVVPRIRNAGADIHASTRQAPPASVHCTH